jgi:transposase
MEAIQKRIDALQEEIEARIAYRKEDLRIAMSIPGVGFTSASTLLAEIGDITDFKKPEQLAAWAGLVPSVYQSAGKLITGSITKHGSRHIRWILVQVARVIARGRNSKLKRFYLRVKAKKGSNVAVVALARKVLCILHHLLTNREMFEEDGSIKKVKIAIEKEPTQQKMNLDEMIAYIVRAGYEVRRDSSGEG